MARFRSFGSKQMWPFPFFRDDHDGNNPLCGRCHRRYDFLGHCIIHRLHELGPERNNNAPGCMLDWRNCLIKSYPICTVQLPDSVAEHFRVLRQQLLFGVLCVGLYGVYWSVVCLHLVNMSLLLYWMLFMSKRTFCFHCCLLISSLENMWPHHSKHEYVLERSSLSSRPHKRQEQF